MNDFASADANIQTAMLEVISEGISGAVFICDRHDLIVFASQQLLNLLPVPKSFLAPGTRLRDFLGAIYDGGGRFATDNTGPRRLLSREDWIAEQIATLWKERAETTERRGSDRWLSYSKRRLASGYGICVVRDVSEHKKREEQWRADMERVQITEEILDNLPFPVAVKDRSLTFVAVNKAACAFLGLSAEEILGKQIADIIRPDLRDKFEVVDRLVLETGDPSRVSQKLMAADGAEFVITGQKRRIGKPGRYFIVTATDILPTDKSLVDGTAEGGLTVVGRGLLCPGLQNSDVSASPDLARRKILVVTRDPAIESSLLEALFAADADVTAVREEAELMLFLSLAGDAGLEIDLVAIDRRMSPDCAAMVENRGIATVLFQHDWPVSDLLSEIAAPLMRDEGRLQEDWQIVPGDVEVETIDVLVAEDNEVNQIVFSQILEGFGHSYVIAADGEEAVRLWRDKRPKLVLMDISLPRLNGFEATRAIRALEEGGDTRTPIVGVLAQAFDRDRENCFAAGMDDVILKPISPEALDAVFSEVPALCNRTQSLAAM